MRFLKKVIALVALVILSVSTFGCQVKTKPFDPNENLDTANVFFDDFTNGINSENWNLMNSKWGINNNGVVPQNVSYTADGIVLIAANGENYSGDIKGYGGSVGTKTGAGLSTRQPLGPGRYEFRLKCMPRFGSTTALWTFFNKPNEDPSKENYNHEIDIELNVENDFTTVWETNWVTENLFDHHVSPTNTINNDGEWHLYKWEWHTNPARIDYYVDNVRTHTSRVHIPTMAGQLNIGNWFPVWAGTPDFERDYTQLDWFRFTPYLNNPFTSVPKYAANPASDYPTIPTAMPKVNLISNGGFENSNFGWKAIDNSSAVAESNMGINNSKALKLQENDMVWQFISGMHETFKLKFTASAKVLSGTGGYISIEYMPLHTETLGSVKIDFNSISADFITKEIELTLPKGTKRIEVSLISNDSSEILFDDIFTNLTKKII